MTFISVNSCQTDINQHKNVCYWLEEPKTFGEAQAECKSKGGELATIDSEETSNFVKDFLELKRSVGEDSRTSIHVNITSH